MESSDAASMPVSKASVIFNRAIASVILTMSVLLLCIFSFSKSNSEILSSPDTRKLSYIPPIKGEYTDYSHEGTRSIPETTTRGIIQQFLSALTSLTPALNNDPNKAAELTEAIDKYEKLSGGYDSTSKLYKNADFQSGIETLMHGTFKSHTLTNTWRDFMQAGTRIRDLVYVVIVTGDYHSKDEWLMFLEKWRFVIESLDLIIIQQGDPAHFVEMPAWSEYLLYNRDDIKRCMGADAWIFDLEHRSNSVRTFGTMLAHREFVFFLDDTMEPSVDPLTGRLTDPIEEHLSNVLRPSTPYYFNPQDPFRHETDFVRGHPYSLREGVPTGRLEYTLSFPLLIITGCH